MKRGIIRAGEEKGINYEYSSFLIFRQDKRFAEPTSDKKDFKVEESRL